MAPVASAMSQHQSQSQAARQQGTKGKEATGSGADAAALREAEAWIIGARRKEWIAASIAGMVLGPVTEI